MLPRWHSFAKAIEVGELVSAKDEPKERETPAGIYLLDKKLQEWEAEKSIGVAVDVLTTAIALGQIRKFEKIGWWLHFHAKDLAPAVQDLVALATLEGYKANKFKLRLDIDSRERVRSLRASLRNFQRDPVALVELSLAHSLLGNKHAAESAMKIAEQIGENNRFVLRSASRFWIHAGDIQRAREIFIRNPMTEHDPWLIAAEIAVSSLAGKSPRLIKAGRRYLDNRAFKPRHLSELAGAVGTLETLEGKRKHARDFFRLSLIDPTENALAQAIWGERSGLNLNVDQERLKTQQAHEALTWRSRMRGDLVAAISSCQAWARDEPFSTVPAQLGSFMCAVIGDFEGAKNFSINAIGANPDNFTVYNNLLVAKMLLGDLSVSTRNIDKLSTMPQTREDSCVLEATIGLYKIFNGSLMDGRIHYSNSIDIAVKDNIAHLPAYAAAFWYEAETKVDGGDASVPLQLFRKYAGRVDTPEMKILRARLPP